METHDMFSTNCTNGIKLLCIFLSFNLTSMLVLLQMRTVGMEWLWIFRGGDQCDFWIQFPADGPLAELYMKICLNFQALLSTSGHQRQGSTTRNTAPPFFSSGNCKNDCFCLILILAMQIPSVTIHHNSAILKMAPCYLRVLVCVTALRLSFFLWRKVGLSLEFMCLKDPNSKCD